VSPVMVRLKMLLSTLDYSFYPVYYRLYDENGVLASKTAFDLEDSSLGLIKTRFIPPPQTVSSLSFLVMKAESIVARTVQLFKDMDGEVPMTDNDYLPLEAQVYPGHDKDDPIMIVCSQENEGRAGTPPREDEAVVGPLDPGLPKQLRGGTTWSKLN
jgi:hypothetical protein